MSDVENVITVEVITEVVTEVVVDSVVTASVIETTAPEIVVETNPVVEVIEVSLPDIIVEASTVTEVITDEGRQGPPGVSEEDMAYAKRLDMVSESVMYKAEAAPGSANSSPAWRIRKITITSDPSGTMVDVEEQWAGGTATFNKVWDDRLTYEYS